MKRISFDSSIAQRVDINMSPMIDCVFLLLIFFIVTTVVARNTGVEIEKPQAVSAETLKEQSILIVLTADGRIVYGGGEVPLNSVRGLVARRVQGGRDVQVVIVADKKAATGTLVELMDECRLAGAQRVSVAAECRERVTKQPVM